MRGYLQSVPVLNDTQLYAQSLEREGRDENASLSTRDKRKSMRALSFA